MAQASVLGRWTWTRTAVHDVQQQTAAATSRCCTPHSHKLLLYRVASCKQLRKNMSQAKLRRSIELSSSVVFLRSAHASIVISQMCPGPTMPLLWCSSSSTPRVDARHDWHLTHHFCYCLCSCSWHIYCRWCHILRCKSESCMSQYHSIGSQLVRQTSLQC